MNFKASRPPLRKVTRIRILLAAGGAVKMLDGALTETATMPILKCLEMTLQRYKCATTMVSRITRRSRAQIHFI